jgi:predicted nucleic acid-binding Zn ribbon protein
MACVRECANCGKEFNPRGPQQNCSKECMRTSRLNQKKEHAEKNRDQRLARGKKYREENKDKLKQIQKKSVEKNKDHYRKYKRKWYEENYERLSDAQRKKYHESFVPVVRNCDICGTEFSMKDRRGQSKTCSDECSYALFKKRTIEKYGWEPGKDRSKSCVICGSLFLFDAPNQDTCSKKCRKTLINKRKRDWYYENLESHIRTEIKLQLGTEPPPDLVEEATALRLLNRALRE